jgi:hypothetical protein
MDHIIKNFTEFSNKALDSGIITIDDAIKYMLNICSCFAQDEIFLKLFPTIFTIERCKRKIKKEDNERITIYL